jgi:ribonucleoside-diphosphate reductase alpha chain
LENTVDMGIRFLDNVIDANKYPLPQTQRVVHGNRKVGLGVMGFADILVRMSVRYGSERSLEIAERLISFIREKAEQTSGRIAESRGNFPFIDKSVISGPRRNATVLSIAPTGTISMIASCSSGIEPYYALSYSKNILGGAHLREINPFFLEVAKRGGFYSPELLQSLSTIWSIQQLGTVPQKVREVFVTAHDIPQEDQINIQAVFQKYVDNAVSKTINLPEHATWKDVYNAYVHAHAKGCKGITVYREGSKPGQVLTTMRGVTPCPTCGSLLRMEEGALQ